MASRFTLSSKPKKKKKIKMKINFDMRNRILKVLICSLNDFAAF